MISLFLLRNVHCRVQSHHMTSFERLQCKSSEGQEGTRNIIKKKWLYRNFKTLNVTFEKLLINKLISGSIYSFMKQCLLG